MPPFAGQGILERRSRRRQPRVEARRRPRRRARPPARHLRAGAPAARRRACSAWPASSADSSSRRRAPGRRRATGFLKAIDGTPVQRMLAENVKPLPTYGAGAFAERPARLPWRRTVGSLFPQTERLDDRLGSGWAAVAVDEATAAPLRANGLRVVDPGADEAWLRRHGLTWALLRPDRFVFACGDAGDVGAGSAAWMKRHGGGAMIGVLGASGRVGRHVAGGLAAAGVPARALVRDPDRVDLPIEAVHADLRRPGTLPAALHGVERLLLLTPHVPDQDLLEAAAVARGRGGRRAPDRQGVRRPGHARTERHHADRDGPLAHRAAHRARGARVRLPAPVVLHAEPARDGGTGRVAARRPRRAVRRRADRHGRRARRRGLRCGGTARRPARPRRVAPDRPAPCHVPADRGAPRRAPRDGAAGGHRRRVAPPRRCRRRASTTPSG